MSQLESCYTDNNTYVQAGGLGGSCLASNSGLDYGTGQGQVEVQSPTASTYTIVAHSKSGQNFTITKQSDGTINRTCTATGNGGCPSSGSW